MASSSDWGDPILREHLLGCKKLEIEYSGLEKGLDTQQVPIDQILTNFDEDDADFVLVHCSLIPVYEGKGNEPHKVTIRHKPAFLSVEQFQCISEPYRRWMQRANYGQHALIDLYEWEALTKEEREKERMNTFCADLMLYYFDELVKIEGVQWREVILECDKDQWTCRRASEQSLLSTQTPQATRAIYHIGKDPHLNISSWWWQTRYVIANLLVCFMTADENACVDRTVTEYVATYLQRMRGINNVASIDNFIEQWRSGSGDLAVDIRGHDSQRHMIKINLEARRIVLDKIEQAKAQAHNQDLPQELSRRFELVCDFFGFTILPGYTPRRVSRIPHRHPGTKRRPLVQPLPTDPINKSPLRNRLIDLGPRVEQLVEALEHLSIQPDLTAALFELSLRDKYQQVDRLNRRITAAPSPPNNCREDIRESDSTLATKASATTATSSGSSAELPENGVVAPGPDVTATPSVTAQSTEPADVNVAATKKGKTRRGGRSAAAKRRAKKLQTATADQ